MAMEILDVSDAACAKYFTMMLDGPARCGSPGLGGLRIAGLYPLVGLLDYEDTRLKTLSRVWMGLSLVWKASLAIRM